jgi:hypothetical protein
MTRKDYESIAYAMACTYRGISDNDTAGHMLFRRAVFNLADELQRNNPRFDRAKFCAACYG